MTEKKAVIPGVIQTIENASALASLAKDYYYERGGRFLFYKSDKDRAVKIATKRFLRKDKIHQDTYKEYVHALFNEYKYSKGKIQWPMPGLFGLGGTTSKGIESLDDWDAFKLMEPWETAPSDYQSPI